MSGRKNGHGTITLHTFGPFMGTPDASPFVIKVVLLFKLAGLAVREVRSVPFGAPKSLLPWIEDDGLRVADSAFIRMHLEKKYGVDFDDGLTSEQKAVAWSVEKMCEEHLYFAMLRARWLDPAIFAQGIGRYMFATLPAPLRPLAKRKLIAMNRRRLIGQGFGRHSSAEIDVLAAKDIDALSDLLGDKPYLMGDKPAGADATMYAMVTAILTPPLAISLKRMMAEKPNLVAYRDRLTRQFFPESLPADLALRQSDLPISLQRSPAAPLS